MGEKGGAVATQLSLDTRKLAAERRAIKIRLSQEANKQDLLSMKRGGQAVASIPVSDVKFELVDVVFKFRLIKSVTILLHQVSHTCYKSIRNHDWMCATRC